MVGEKLSEGFKGRFRFKPKSSAASGTFETRTSSFDVDEVMRRIWARYEKCAESE